MRELVSGAVLPSAAKGVSMGQDFVLVRVVHGVRSHFSARASEWVLCGMMLTWGIVLLRPSEIFSTNASYSGLAAMASENAWGYAMVVAGLARFTALVLNGTFAGTVYARYSPLVRSFAATTGAVFWALISWSMISSLHLSTGWAVYPWLFALEMCCVWRASQEADRSLRNVLHL